MSISYHYAKVIINPICILCVLGLFFLTWNLPALAFQKAKVNSKKGVVHSMVVIHIEPPEKDLSYITVIFRISQRYYKLPKNGNPKYLKLLKESEKNNTPVLVRRAKEESDVIVSVEKPEKP